MGKGITGVLLPDGKFLDCTYKEHGVILKNLSPYQEKTSVYFSSANLNTESQSLVYFGEEVTSEQKRWILLHYLKLDPAQKKMLKENMPK